MRLFARVRACRAHHERVRCRGTALQAQQKTGSGVAALGHEAYSSQASQQHGVGAGLGGGGDADVVKRVGLGSALKSGVELGSGLKSKLCGTSVGLAWNQGQVLNLNLEVSRSRTASRPLSLDHCLLGYQLVRSTGN